MIDVEQYENNSKPNSMVKFTFFGKYSFIMVKIQFAPDHGSHFHVLVVAQVCPTT